MHVAPRAGAWIETHLDDGAVTETKMSPLAQGRGLKLVPVRFCFISIKSPLAQGRGLKLQ